MTPGAPIKRLKVMALDLGTVTGVAVGCAGEAPALQTEILGKGLEHGARFSALRRTVGRLLTDHGPDLLVIEAPIPAGPKGKAARLELAYGYRASVYDAAYTRATRVREFSVSSVRAHFIGEGNMESEAAKAAVFSRCRSLGWDPQNTDESDAAAVWDLACSILAPHLHSAVPLGGLF